MGKSIEATNFYFKVFKLEQLLLLYEVTFVETLKTHNMMLLSIKYIQVFHKIFNNGIKT